MGAKTWMLVKASACTQSGHTWAPRSGHREIAILRLPQPKSVHREPPMAVTWSRDQVCLRGPMRNCNSALVRRPRAGAEALDSLDQYIGGVGRQRLQVVRIGREYSPAGFRERHDQRIDG